MIILLLYFLLLNACGQHLIFRLGLTSTKEDKGQNDLETARNNYANIDVWKYVAKILTLGVIALKSIS